MDEKYTYGLWGAAAGAAALAVVGFTWGDWYTSKGAAQHAQAAVQTAMIPACVKEVMADPAAAAELKVKRTSDYDDAWFSDHLKRVGDKADRGYQFPTGNAAERSRRCWPRPPPSPNSSGSVHDLFCQAIGNRWPVVEAFPGPEQPPLTDPDVTRTDEYPMPDVASPPVPKVAAKPSRPEAPRSRPQACGSTSVEAESTTGGDRAHSLRQSVFDRGPHLASPSLARGP